MNHGVRLYEMSIIVSMSHVVLWGMYDVLNEVDNKHVWCEYMLCEEYLYDDYMNDGAID